MIKKSLFKKITALALATCLATSPAVIYAADDAVEVFVEEETVTQDEASSDEDYAEEVFTEDVNEEENIEDNATDEPEFVGDDVVEENNEPEFVQEDSVVTEDSANEEVAAAEEAFGVDDVHTEIVENKHVLRSDRRITVHCLQFLVRTLVIAFSVTAVAVKRITVNIHGLIRSVGARNVNDDNTLAVNVLH